MTVTQFARQLAREFRKNPTPAEKQLWTKLRGKHLLGLKFLFQHPIFYRYENKKRFFVADFYCHKLKLVIEVDGGIHIDSALPIPNPFPYAKGKGRKKLFD